MDNPLKSDFKQLHKNRLAKFSDFPQNKKNYD